MDGLEKAIRAALDKGDTSDRTYREKVYRSAFAALERTGQDNAALDERRTSLKQTIARIEADHIPCAAPSVRPDEANAGTGALPHQEPDLHATPDLRATVDPSPAPAWDESEETGSLDAIDRGGRDDWGDEYRIDADLDETIPGEPRAVRRRKRPLALIFVIATLVVLGLLIWAVMSTIFSRQASGDGSVPNPSPIGQQETFAPDGTAMPRTDARPIGQAEDPDAIAIFTAAPDVEVGTPGDAQTEMVEGEEGPYLRITSGASGSAVVFDVPAAILEEIAGKRAVFVIAARAEEGQATQFSVTCAFGELGDCGRQRYQANYERGDFVFDVDMPQGEPGSDGSIAIVSDVASEGRSLDVHAIRVLAD